MENMDLKVLKKMIDDIETAAKGLVDNAEGIQAIERNVSRILASTKMLQINVSDIELVS